MQEQFKSYPANNSYQVGSLGTITKDGKVIRTPKNNKPIFINGSFVTIQDMINSTFEAKPIQTTIKKEKPVKSTTTKAIIKAKPVHGNTGRKHKPETIKLIAESMKGKKENKLTYIIEGIEYNSLKLASIAIGLHKTSIYRRCKANKNGYSFKPFPQ